MVQTVAGVIRWLEANEEDMGPHEFDFGHTGMRNAENEQLLQDFRNRMAMGKEGKGSDGEKTVVLELED